MTQTIQQRLTELESDRRVRVLYACESGSRAWGFASPDSDYDVRFIYAHPVDWYLSIFQDREVIEVMDGDLDLSGWELRKALRLLRKSNPPLLEWLSSPIVYSVDESFLQQFRTLAEEYYSPERCFRHYLHMAEGNFRSYLQGDTVWTKKYLYVLRPVLACRWIERGLGVVPMEFRTVLESTVQDEHLMHAIDALLERKQSGAELQSGPRDEAISGFLEAEIARLSAMAYKQEPEPDQARLDAFFRATIARE